VRPAPQVSSILNCSDDTTDGRPPPSRAAAEVPSNADRENAAGFLVALTAVSGEHPEGLSFRTGHG
jgi:hypothetical protein